MKVSDTGGSSPLTRGKRHSQRDRLPTDRLIPAHAGKTGAGAGYFSERAAHPRSRGENWFVRHPGCVASGSSPLTRGKQRTTPAPITVDGLIPAHAGKTGDGGRDPERAQAHPRSRGENSYIPGGDTGVKGSSPLTRGKRQHHHCRPRDRRLIPAHAGKTAASSWNTDARRAHPRSRGENQAVWTGIQTTVRLIPAHAGKTPSS